VELHGVNTWFDSHHGVVEMDGDVLGVVQRIKEIGQGRLHVFYNEQSDEFDLVESCLDGTDRLVFSVESLDQRVIDRLQRADHWGADTPEHRDEFRPDHSDFVAEIDESNEVYWRDKEEASREKLLDAGEQLAYALEEDGKGIGASISVNRDVSGPAKPK
jgi:hypothetical protein